MYGEMTQHINNRKIYIQLNMYIYTTKGDKENYVDYIKEAYSDLKSAEKEDNEKWAITKAYQSLFLMCNALLVKNLGYYSKDHERVVIALMKNKIIASKTIEKISKILNKGQELDLKPKKDFFEE